MGAYSSWASMAITHHVIVRWAAHRVKVKNFNKYALLGDDIVIADSVVSESYKRLLADLDMPFSLAKTHVSSDTTFEFAKRWYIKGTEVTPFSMGGLESVYKRYYLLHNFLLNQAKHG